MSAHEHPWDAHPCTALPQSPSLQGEEGGTRTQGLAVPAEASPTSHEQFSKARNQLVPLHPGWSQSPAARRDTGPKPPCFPFHLPKGQGRCSAHQGLPAPAAPTPQHPRSHAPALPHQTRSQGQHWVPYQGPASPSLPKQPPGLSALFRALHKQTAKISEVTWHHQSVHSIIPHPFSSPPASPSAPATHPALI